MLDRVTVLVIEDNPHTRKMIRLMLHQLGVRRVIEAEDALSGIEMVRSQRPDIVILDWEMPHINGSDAMSIIRAPDLFPYSNVPVIMITATPTRRRIVEAAKLGVHEILCKPISPKNLYLRLCSVLARPRPFLRTPEYYGPWPRRQLLMHGKDFSRAVIPPAANADAPARQKTVGKPSGPTTWL